MTSYHVTVVYEDFPFEADDDAHARHLAGDLIDRMVKRPSPGMAQLAPDFKVVISDPSGRKIDQASVAEMTKKPKP